MFKRLYIFIYSLLYDLGFIKFTTIFERINYLKYKKVSLYNLTCRSNNYKFIESDIITYITVLHKLNSFNYLNETITIKNITEDTLYYKTYIMWFTDKNNILDNAEKVLYEFLIEAEKLLYTYDNIKDNFEDTIRSFNSKKLKPYIINLHKIIEDLSGG